jgi:hypothetical protein
VRDPNHCFSPVGPGGPLSFMAPRWTGRAGGPAQRELRGTLTQVEYNDRLHPHWAVDWLEDIPVLGRFITGLLVFVTNVVWIPISIVRYRRLKSFVRPDLDWSLFLGPYECEIAADRRVARNNWRPPRGTPDVRLYGDWVVDLGHTPHRGETDPPPDGKSEIHPIHWVTWKERASADGNTVVFRTTVMADASGRFPPYADVPGAQGSANNVISANIRYSLTRDVWPGIQSADWVIGATVDHRPELPFHWQVVQDGVVHQVDPDAYQFDCQVRGRVGEDAEVCQTTQRSTNTAGFWDGRVVFTRARPPGLTAGEVAINWHGGMQVFYARVGLLKPDPGAGYEGPCEMFNAGTQTQPVPVCRGRCEAGTCRLLIERTEDGGRAGCVCR